MMSTYTYPVFDYAPCEDQRAATPPMRPVVVCGGGPVGISAAIDLAQHGVPVVLLDEDNTVSIGSRAVCYAKRALEIWDRLGCAKPMIDQGVVWKIGKVFRQDRQIYQFDLLPESDHKIPAFINLQQYYLEEYLVNRARELGVDIRWKNKLISAADKGDHVRLQIETPDGVYPLDCRYLVAADGAKSGIRKMLNLDFKGQIFQDRFLIADVVMKADFPAERWFWFDPPFHPKQSALLHMQSDNVWRIDFQLGWDADPEEEKKPERVIPRLKAMLGKKTQFDLEWVSVYTFQCRRLDKFRHGRVLFVGDAAHQVSPFGARGANSGVQDTDNMAWKLALVLDGKAPDALLDTFSDERVQAADENLTNSTRSTDFITPKSAVSRAFREAVLDLAEDFPFARALVNSGRLSMPATHADSALNTPDDDAFTGRMIPGAPCLDAPITGPSGDGWLLDRLGGWFTLVGFGVPTADLATAAADLSRSGIPVQPLAVAESGQRLGERIVSDTKGLAAERYDAKPGTVYLIRPDQHVAARWRRLDAAKAEAALARATCRR